MDADLAEDIESLGLDEADESELQYLAWQMLFPPEQDPFLPLPSVEAPGTVEATPDPNAPFDLDSWGEDTTPIANAIMDAVEEVAGDAVWRPAYPPGGDRA